MKRISIAVILSIVLTIAIIFGVMMKNRGVTNETAKTETLDNIAEMRGLWVSYITLDMSNTDRSFESFKTKFDAVIEDALSIGTNTLIVQVRPFSDALYKSEVYPASHVLSGVQGEEAGYDALEYMCDASHKKGLKVHAWINPYRVSTATSPDVLADDNPYYIEDFGYETESGRYLDPSKAEVRDLITEGVAEIVENYKVDGVQFDDYFYPADSDDFDKADYETYIESTPNIIRAMEYDTWRENNVNLLVSQVFRKIKTINENVVFGIAPQGNIENDYELSADVKSWCEQYGYVDYICPQMYYSIQNPIKSFETSLSEWNDLQYHEKIKRYIGIGAYKAGTDADGGTWLNNSQELKNQLELLRKYSYDGYMIYDYSALTKIEARDTIAVMKEVI
ncbi:MAG: family 10 glycosylhydrolase [Eubacteriales bacterium]|nr:family 10 glycosylhydrolase [Eubacteriales bacterium]